jgi:dTDP-4-dehydrorhamnose reductase
MRLLIIHDDTPLIEKLNHLVQQRVEPIDFQKLPISTNLETLKKTIKQTKPDQILFLAMLSPKSNEKEKSHFVSQIKSIVAICQSQTIPLLLLSSASVFSTANLTIDETSPTEPNTELGKTYDTIEKLCLNYQHSIILRTGWIFSGKGNNFLTEALDCAIKGQKIAFNSAGKGCPTHASDLARVILGMSLQLPFMPQARGIYHYVSSDASIGFQFLETLLTAAANFDTSIDPKNILFEHQVIEGSPFFFEPVMLSCGRLLYHFGIHQRPWRSSINQAVSVYFTK